MIKSNSCYTEYLLKMGISQAVQYNTVQFARAQNQYHIRKTFTEHRDFCSFSSNYLPRPKTSLLM